MAENKKPSKAKRKNIDWGELNRRMEKGRAAIEEGFQPAEDELRKILRADHSKREEYRRHVTMTASLSNGETIEVNIDIAKEYYDKTRQFVDFVAQLLEK